MCGKAHEYKRPTILVRVGLVNKTRKHDYEIHRDAVDARDWRDATRRDAT